MIDYLIRVILAGLTTAGVLHLWFRTHAGATYIGVLSVPAMERYIAWAEGRKKWHREMKAKLRSGVVTPTEEDTKKCPSCAAKAVARAAVVAQRNGGELPEPDTSVPAWIAATQGDTFFGSLVTCYHCLGVWVAAAASLLALAPFGFIAAYFIAITVFEARRGGRNG